jgi:hypothetical protein
MVITPAYHDGGVSYMIGRAQMSVSSVKSRDASVDKYIVRVENAIKYRKPESRNTNLIYLKHALAEQRSTIGVLERRLKEAKQQALEAEAKSSTGANPKVVELAKEVHRLAQAIPLSGDIPLTPSDHVLRAIATILANAGFVSKKG